jgi:hypothetical protein
MVITSEVSHCRHYQLNAVLSSGISHQGAQQHTMVNVTFSTTDSLSVLRTLLPFVGVVVAR